MPSFIQLTIIQFKTQPKRPIITFQSQFIKSCAQHFIILNMWFYLKIHYGNKMGFKCSFMLAKYVTNKTIKIEQ